MRRTTKIAISLPKDDFKRIEEIRKELGSQRSAVVDMAIQFWLKSLDAAKEVERYEDGYRKKPESLEEIKAMEKVSAEAFYEEGLK